MELLIIVLATVLNLITLKFKFDRERYGDLILDVGALAALSWAFGGTLGGMVIASCAGALITVYLFFSPAKFMNEPSS